MTDLGLNVRVKIFVFSRLSVGVHVLDDKDTQKGCIKDEKSSKKKLGSQRVHRSTSGRRMSSIR